MILLGYLPIVSRVADPDKDLTDPDPQEKPDLDPIFKKNMIWILPLSRT